MRKTPYLGWALFFGMASVCWAGQSARSSTTATASQESSANSKEQARIGGFDRFFEGNKMVMNGFRPFRGRNKMFKKSEKNP